MAKTKCLNPDCERVSETRGLCGTCYTVIREIVTAGQKTWAELEAEGKVLPKKRRPSTARQWVLGTGKKKKKGT